MRQRGLNKLSNALLYGEYKGDALIGGNLVNHQQLLLSY